ncbi:MAG TPA: ATP-binding protein, partial [Caldimonas sp.]|nr:ATP-binding protein [Caldimonas sp.]
GDLVPNRRDTLPGQVLAQGRPIITDAANSQDRYAIPRSYIEAGLRHGVAVPLSDRGRIIGALKVRWRRDAHVDGEELRFLESLSSLLATTLQRTRSEEALNHAARLESVGQLTGGIAHDFNNLLTVIQGNLQVLEERPGLANDAQAVKLLTAATRAARRGAELTRKLLAFSRRQVLQPTTVDVPALLESLADMLRRTVDQHIRIEVDAAGALNCRADPGQLESALLNIAINARDAMPQGGVLRFRASACRALPESVFADRREPPAAGFVAIAITDTGSGMSEEVRERAFEPFFTTKPAGRGTGLGLSTVYGFVQQSNGALAIESALGAGTTVTLYIPAERAAAPVHDASVEDALPAGLRVLLVEDDAEVRQVARRFLDVFGCRVTECATAEPARARLEAGEAYDLLLSDIALGAGMRGTELAAWAQDRYPEMGVLLVSGFSKELVDADRDSPPEWELLGKPYTREELAAAISRAVRR